MGHRRGTDGTDTSTTLDARAFGAGLQRSDEARLRRRLEQAVLDGTLASDADASVLAEFVQTVWQGLSARAELGASRDELIGVSDLTLTLISNLTQEAVPAPVSYL